MNDTKSNLTSWALDELDDNERSLVEKQLQDNPRTREEAEATKEFCLLLSASLTQDAPSLTEEERQSLREAFAQQPPARGPSHWFRWGGASLAAAACLTLGLWATFQWQNQNPNTISLDLRSSPATPSPAKTDSNRRSAGSSDKSGGHVPSGEIMDKTTDPSSPQPTAETLADNNAPIFAENAKKLSMEAATAPVDPEFPLPPVTPEIRALTEKPDLGAIPTPLVMADADPAESESAEAPRATIVAGATPPVAKPQEEAGIAMAAPAPAPAPADPAPLAKRKENNGEVPAARQSELQGMAAKPEPFGTERDEKLRHRPAPGLPMPPPFIPPHPVPEVSGDAFAAIIENPLREVSADPLSTFSIDVDTASYAIVRRYLNQGRVPPSDAVRLEEFINYFPYDYAQPEGDSPFAVNVEINQAPWKKAHRLARIGIKGTTPPVAKRQAANLVFLLDVSGSMSDDNKLPLLKQSLRLLIDRLDENDRVSLVTYAGHSGVALPPTPGHQKARILDVLDQLQAGGSTDGASGIEEAYRLAKESFVDGGVNRVILATDGDFNVGITDQDKLVELIQQKARDGVFLSVLGFGEGNLKDSTMELLADKGNGNYAYIDALGEGRKVLVEQMGGTLVTIAKDVKIQVEFNPAVIRSYRLIGYENRMLAKEDFNDDKKDAGEIGAGHTVTALYELIPVHAAPGAEDDRPAIDALKYQKVPAPALTDEAAKGEAFTLKLRYKAPDGDESRLLEIPVTDSNAVLDKASPEFQFSTAVAGFGLMLRDSSYKGELDWDVVRNLALQGKGPDPFGYRGEFLQLIDKARGLLQTKDQ